jgi:hypothetical protein
VITKKGNFSNIQVPAYMVRLNYRVTDQVRYFPFPDYSAGKTLSSPIPDTRNTLFWSSPVSDKNIKEPGINFYSGDTKGNYTVNVQGIDAGGNPVSSATAIIVR